MNDGFCDSGRFQIDKPEIQSPPATIQRPVPSEREGRKVGGAAVVSLFHTESAQSVRAVEASQGCPNAGF